MVTAIGRTPVELRGLLKGLPVELGAGNSRLMQIIARSSSMERVHTQEYFIPWNTAELAYLSRDTVL